MKFENARKGLGKIFAGEVVSIIATVITVAAAVLIAYSGTLLKAEGKSINTTDIISLISMIVALVLTVVAFLLNLIGIIAASKDDEGFKNALAVLVLGLVATIVSSILLKSHPNIAGYLSSLHDICQLFVLYYVVSGCVSIASSMKKDNLVSSGNRAKVIIIIVWVISLVLNFLNKNNAKNETVGTIALILTIAGGVASIVSYIIYLSVIRRTIDIID